MFVSKLIPIISAEKTYEHSINKTNSDKIHVRNFSQWKQLYFALRVVIVRTKYT